MLPDWQLHWQVSAGRFSELLLPAAYALSVLVSAFVLADARRLRLSPFASAVWTLCSLLFPHIVLPLYLIARLYARRTETHTDAPAAPANLSHDEPSHADGETSSRSADGSSADDETLDAGASNADAETSSAPAAPRVRRRLALPLVYAATLLAGGALYFYVDYHSTDAHLARAEQAKLESRTARAVSEYRAALRRRDDPHVRKLLGLELSKAGRWEEALAELRAAGRGGEPDDALDFHTAHALAASGRAAEAADAYRRFLQAPACAQTLPDPRCDAARAFLNRPSSE